jgi:hypothetical protein
MNLSLGLDTFKLNDYSGWSKMKLPPNHQTNQPVKKKKSSSHLEQINHNAAGIDLGSAEHWVCVGADKAEKNEPTPTQSD